MKSSARATLRDLAAAVGVAESTVSRALNGNALISPETRERILQAASDLGYLPRRRGTIEGRDRNGVVGVVVGALHNAFYPFFVNRLHDELDALGYDMILIIDDLSNSSTSRKIQTLIDTSLAGVIFATASVGSPAVDLLVERGIPTILAIRSNRRGNVGVVESDNKMAGAEAVAHLLELGHRRIGFLLGPQNTSTSIDRMGGAERVLRDAGVKVSDALVVWGEYSHDSGYSGLSRLMSGQQKPTAFFCGNDVIAIGALDAAIKLGLDVPGDISIIGVDDIPMASWSMVSLTTVRQPIGEIGSLAARRLVACIEGANKLAPTIDILPTSLVRRNSTGPVSQT